MKREIPWADTMPAPWAPSGGEKMVEAMRLQVARLRQEGPEVAAGNILWLAEVRRGRIEMWAREAIGRAPRPRRGRTGRVLGAGWPRAYLFEAGSRCAGP